MSVAIPSFNISIRSDFIFCYYFRKEGASLYDVLGVDKNATQEEIKKAYRKVRLVQGYQ